jgi:hypothetical protein
MTARCTERQCKLEASRVWLITNNTCERFEIFMVVNEEAIFWHVAFVRTHVSEKCSTSIIRVTRISEQGTTLAVTSNRPLLQRNESVN